MSEKRWDLYTTKPQRYDEYIFRWGLTKRSAILSCRQINKELRDSGDNWTRYYPVEHKPHIPMYFRELEGRIAMPDDSVKYLY